MTNTDLTNYFDTIPNNFIIYGDYNTKHQIWRSRVANPCGNLLYNLININKYKILSPLEPTYWPTSLKIKPDIMDIFVAKVPSNLYCTLNNNLDLNFDRSSVILNINTSPQSLNNRQSLFSSMTKHYKFHNL